MSDFNLPARGKHDKIRRDNEVDTPLISRGKLRIEKLNNAPQIVANLPTLHLVTSFVLPPDDYLWGPVLCTGSHFIVKAAESLLAFDVVTGRLLWRRPGFVQVFHSICPIEELILIPYGDEVVAIQANTGESAWVYEGEVDVMFINKNEVYLYERRTSRIHLLDARSGSTTPSTGPIPTTANLGHFTNGFEFYYAPRQQIAFTVTFESDSVLGKYWYTESGFEISAVYVGFDDQTRTALWRTDCNWRHAFQYDTHIETSIALIDEQVIVRKGPHKISALSITTGIENWTFDAGDNDKLSRFVATERSVFVHGQKALHALDLDTGAPNWHQRGRLRLAKHGLAYLETNRTSNRSVRAHDVATGELLWEFSGAGGKYGWKVEASEKITYIGSETFSTFGAPFYDKHENEDEFYLHAVDSHNGRHLFSVETNSPILAMSANSELLLVVLHDSAQVLSIPVPMAHYRGEMPVEHWRLDSLQDGQEPKTAGYRLQRVEST